MKSVRLYAKGDLRFENVESPGLPNVGWVRMKITAAGICGSDIHNYRTGRWIGRAPSVAGHEFTGYVTAVGATVETLNVGDYVVADSRFWCGECGACHEGRRHFCESLGFVGEVCDGGFAEEIVLPERLLIKIDPAIPPEVAATAEPFAVALHAVMRLNAPAGTAILIVGCGPIGGFTALIARKLIKGPIFVADRNFARAELVADVTGAQVVELATPDISHTFKGQNINYAIEASGNIAALNSLVNVVSSGANIALVGIYHGVLDFDPNTIVEREITLLGCHAFQDELSEAAELLKNYSDDIKKFIHDIISLEDVPAAYQRLIAGNTSGLKTIIRM